MTKEISQPGIRFKDSKGEWKPWKIGDLLTEIYRPILLEEEKEYQLVTVKRRNEGVVSRGYLMGKNILVKNYFEVEEGDFIISKRQVIHGASGIIPKSLHKAVVSNEYLVASSNENITTEYLTLISKQPDMYKKFFLSSYGVDIEKMVFDVKDWKKKTIEVPEPDEQKRIVDFFIELDKIILFVQERSKNLVWLKKAMLESMFPKTNSTHPNIRFCGFKNDWVVKKISEVATVNPKSTLPESFNYVDLESVVGTKMISFKKVHKSEAPSRAQRLAHKGDLFYQTVRPYQKNNYLFEGSDLDYVFSTGYAQLRPVVDGNFLLSLVQSHSFLNQVLIRSTGTSYPAIKSSDLAEIETQIPEDPDEQIQIGAFFECLDNLIDLNQRKINKIKELKKALSIKMLV